MSISLLGLVIGVALSPAIIAARAIVGKEKFDGWINSQYDKCQTNINIKELTKVINDAGYDLTQYIGSYKTHYDRTHTDFFWWEEKDGFLTAEFLKSDKEKYTKFIRDIEKTAGKTIFVQSWQTDIAKTTIKGDTDKGVITEHAAVKPTVSVKSEEKQRLAPVQTIYTDRDLLINALNDYGAKFDPSANDMISARIDGFRFNLSKPSEDAPFELSIQDPPSKDAAENLTNRLDPEYTRMAQEKAYLGVKENCRTSGYEVVDEEVLDDNSIVLTILV